MKKKLYIANLILLISILAVPPLNAFQSQSQSGGGQQQQQQMGTMWQQQSTSGFSMTQSQGQFQGQSQVLYIVIPTNIPIPTNTPMPSNTPTPRISRAPTNTPIPRNQRQGQAVQGAQTQTSQITNEATPAATITAQVQKQEVNNTSFFGWITSFFRSAQAQ